MKDWMPDDEFRIRLYRAMDEFEKLIADHPEYLDDECRRELRRFRRKLGAPEAEHRRTIRMMKAAADQASRQPGSK